MPLIIRPARPDDAPALTQIMHAAKASWGYPDDLMEQWRKAWQITLEVLQKTHCIVAERNGLPVAFSGQTATDRKATDLSYLYVAPDAQKSGIGKLLLKRSEDFARRSGSARMTLRSEVNAGGFYEASGYATTGQEPSTMAPGRFMPLMEKRLSADVHSLRAVDLHLSEDPWQFETENAAGISEHFAKAREDNPHLWNGRLLILTDYSFKDGVLTGSCSETSFAAFLTWRDWGAPDWACNIFGCAILRTVDNALLYGLMADHTATAGMIYPPGGNIDPADADSSGKIDVDTTVKRELLEETGVPAENQKQRDSLIIFDGARVAIAHVYDVDQTGETLRREILKHSNASDEKELADIRLIKTSQDLEDPAITSHARALGLHLLG